MDHIWIGISGWTYAGWRGVFYPRDLPHKRELEYAGTRFNSIEINGTFYSLQRPSSFRGWYAATPPHFRFAVKGSRFITHMKKLKEVDAALANFFASGVLALNEKLGPVLWQFPPQLAFNADRFEAFLELLPKTTTAASQLAKKHDERVTGRAWLRTDRHRRIRHAFEVRHESFIDDAFFRLLRRHKAALVVSDSAGEWPFIAEPTTDFMYVRLHGGTELYTSGYGAAELAQWAKLIRRWQRDVYVYFDNDRKVRAPFDAMQLAERLGMRQSPPRLRKTA